MLDVKNLTVRYGNVTIVDDVNFSLGERQWMMIVGPNGAGKSTIVNAISQGVPYTGEVRFQGADVKRYRAHELAKRMGVLMQNHYVGYSFSVGEVVRLGRYAYSPGMFSVKTDTDVQKVERALTVTGMKPFEEHSVLTLSGGELQRTFLAQLFAQDPQLLILDEPTNHLDLVYQKHVFSLIQKWIADTGRSVISVVHDLSLALKYGTHALLLGEGRVVSLGKVRDVLSRGNLQSVYDMDVYAWMQSMLSGWQD